MKKVHTRCIAVLLGSLVLFGGIATAWGTAGSIYFPGSSCRTMTSAGAGQADVFYGGALAGLNANHYALCPIALDTAVANYTTVSSIDVFGSYNLVYGSGASCYLWRGSTTNWDYMYGVSWTALYPYSSKGNSGQDLGAYRFSNPVTSAYAAYAVQCRLPGIPTFLHYVEVVHS